MDERMFWLGFSVFPGIGPFRFKLLLDYFGSAAAAWNAPLNILQDIKLGNKLSLQFADFRRKFDFDKYRRLLAELHVSFLTQNDPKYPKLLKLIPDAPIVLYVKGKKTTPPMNLDRTIAVVGTRKISSYGRAVTEKLVADLVNNGFTIVSGMAYGVDAVAHQTALNLQGKTIAVLGCGIDIIAPPSNAKLYEEICRGGGAVVSEMPLGLRPAKGLFPARNRIISGLSLGVVVTEGADDSGALITARFAGEQGREVFAVPGPITSPNSRGPFKLLKNGAKLVESINDILEELGLDQKVKRTGITAKADNVLEAKILKILTNCNMHIDEIARGSNLTISAVAATVTVLEMKGAVKDLGDKVYCLA